MFKRQHKRHSRPGSESGVNSSGNPERTGCSNRVFSTSRSDLIRYGMTELLLSVLFITIASMSFAQLDLDQEVLIVPDTHDAEPYKWNTKWFTWGYNVQMEHGTLIAGNDSEFTFRLKAKRPVDNVHVFITDSGLNVFKHLRPESDNSIYHFVFNAPSQGKYRFEFVFKNDKEEWINLSENVSVKEGVKREVPPEQLKDYSVNVKMVPETVYADHVVTLIYEISHLGSPLMNPDAIDGAEIHIGAWDESRREFIYAKSRQNVNGQIAASIVFMSPGRYRVFAEFIHNGMASVVHTDIDVLKENLKREGGVFSGE